MLQSFDYFNEHCGKWILAGEHSVLRGSSALVFPLQSKSLKISYIEDSSPLRLEVISENKAELKGAALGIIDTSFESLGLEKNQLKGTLSLINSIPVGAGLGASASLCVAMSEWLSWLKLLPKEDVFVFSKKLEDLFHGQSSGLDISVVMQKTPLSFSIKKGYEKISLKWKPYLFLSYTGHKGSTVDCVSSVVELIHKKPEWGRSLDEQMSEAVSLCYRALIGESESNRLADLSRSLNKAYGCFKSWGLIDDRMDSHIRWLRENGAIAVKPTGSGGGGFVLSLWLDQPEESLLQQLIPCF